MNQEKIGRFIAACRKKQNLTQAALAEQLGITDRAVSKWETGKSLPDSSIMLELCALLSISVNELLKGEKVDMENNQRASEELIFELKEQVEVKARMLLKLEIFMGVITLTAFAVLILTGVLLMNRNQVAGTVLIVSGVIILFAFAFVGTWIEQQAGYSECAVCGYRYQPTYKNVVLAPHIGRTRKMRCPKCGKKSYHKKVLSLKD